MVAWREVAEADKGSGTAVRGWATAVVDTGDRVCVGGSITGARFLAVRDGRYKPREKEKSKLETVFPRGKSPTVDSRKQNCLMGGLLGFSSPILGLFKTAQSPCCEPREM